MSIPPDHEFRSHEYDRPNREWICGGEANGMPCPLGPSHRGQCNAICTPVREGDRYYCNQSSEMGGDCDEGPAVDGSCCQIPPQCCPTKRQGKWVCNRGKCQEGPFPDGTCSQKFAVCSPVRTVLAKRRIVVTTTFGLTVGLLLIVTNASQRQLLISPGTLTSHHQSLDGCQACHPSGDGHLVNWVQAAFVDHAEIDQSRQCLTCHRDEVGIAPLLAHGVGVETLEAITRTRERTGASPPFFLSLARATRPTSRNQLACATCHREHRGKNFDMTRLSDMQCQICHSESFHSFSSDHPPFSDWPYQTRTNLYFDHATHRSYFSQKVDMTWSCSTCHSADATGSAMPVSGYEASCASCHDDQINSVLIPGIPFFALPAIDTTALDDIGDWPEIYPKHVQGEGTISALTDLLLASNQQYANAKARIDDLDLSDLTQATPEQRSNVQQFVWSFKIAFLNLTEEGSTKFRARLSSALSVTPPGDARVDRFYRELVAARQRWLPQLADDVAATTSADDNRDASTEAERGNGAVEPISQESLEQERTHIRDVRSGWYLRDSDLSVRYRPYGHADALLKTFLEAAAISTLDAADPTEMFKMLSSPTAPGRCMKCHTAVANDDGTIAIRWLGRQPDLNTSGFTRFTHAPHVRQTDVDSCQQCHVEKIDTAEVHESRFRSGFIHADWSINTNAGDARSDFVALDNASCSQCHTPRGTDQSCLTCHNYHVTVPKSSIRSAP